MSTQGEYVIQSQTGSDDALQERVAPLVRDVVSSIVATLSRQLTTRYGIGLSEKNLRTVVQSSQVAPDTYIFQTLSGQFPALWREKITQTGGYAMIQCIKELFEPWIVSSLRRQLPEYQRIPPEQYGF